MPINVGGDGSVIWRVDVGRAIHADSDPNHTGPPIPYFHEGVEQTADNEKLVVKVKLPAGDPSPTLQNCPSGSVKTVGGRIFVTFVLPIEANNGKPGRGLGRDPDQVSIDFKPSGSPIGVTPRTMKSKATTTKRKATTRVAPRTRTRKRK